MNIKAKRYITVIVLVVCCSLMLSSCEYSLSNLAGLWADENDGGDNGSFEELDDATSKKTGSKDDASNLPADTDSTDETQVTEKTDETKEIEASDEKEESKTEEKTEFSEETESVKETDKGENATETQINKVEINQTIQNNEITIEGNGGNVAYATSAGLRSVVSIYCTFESVASAWNPYTQLYYSTGSGVIYKLDNSGNAFIITNFHVVYDSSSNTEDHISDNIYVYLYGMESETYGIYATYVGGSPNYDIAVLRVDESEVLKAALETGAVSAVTVGDSDKLYPGQTTIAIGNPSTTGLSGISVTSGIVSVDSEYISMTAADNSGEVSFRVIRTDAAVNSGNSGGGMFNDKGELIGIVNAKINNSSIENIGYAIPSNVARAIADNIIDYCYGKDCKTVIRGLLGVTVNKTALSTKYDSESGFVIRIEEITVREVTKGGLAEDILVVGDVVKSITIGDVTRQVTRQYHVIDAMLDVRVGDTVSMEIERDGVKMTVSTEITEDCLVAY